MPIYPIPVYTNRFNQLDFEKVKKELIKIHDKTKYESRAPAEHGISDITFSSNLIKDNKLKTLEREIIKHGNNFVNAILNQKKINLRLVESWMTSTKENEFAPKHDHGSYDISGVIYIKTNGKDGSLYFESPTKQCTSSFLFRDTHPPITIPPQEGLIILFPGWLEHGVMANITNNERISVSFNLNVIRN
jgi:uncharacterized protein (TIGR02466 family)